MAPDKPSHDSSITPGLTSEPGAATTAPMVAKPSLLMDLRPCYEGFAGIAQEARLLFALFADIGLQLGGLASGVHFVARPAGRAHSPFDRVLAQTNRLIATDTGLHHTPFGLARLLPASLARLLERAYLVAAHAGRTERLQTELDPVAFGDYLWTRLFERTLPASTRPALARARYFTTEIGHENARHLAYLPPPMQRRIDTAGWDVFFACTATPYRVAPRTATLIRYYDALPLLSPHTVGDPGPHARSHARLLGRSMAAGASFVCDSEPVRADLLRMFPQAEARVRTIPCLLAPDFRPDPPKDPELRAILTRRAANAGPPPPEALPRLVMAVATLEPRKNWLRLFRAVEAARRRANHPLQLLVIANPGWRSEAEQAILRDLVQAGAFHLTGVPIAELRALYSAAHLVAAPSRAEGFDYSGAEAMACGTPVLASDTAVHRWVYGDAAEYVDAYDDDAWADALARLADLPREEGRLAELRARGLRQAALYTAAALRPRWEQAVLDAAAGPPHHG